MSTVDGIAVDMFGFIDIYGRKLQSEYAFLFIHVGGGAVLWSWPSATAQLQTVQLKYNPINQVPG